MGEDSVVAVTQQTDEVSHIESEPPSEGVSRRVCCSGAESGFLPCSGRSTSDVRVMATNFAEICAVRKVSWRRNVEENATRRNRPAATVTKRETTCFVPRRQSSDPELHERVSAWHIYFYQGHLHTPLTYVSLKSRGPCTPMPLVRVRSMSLRSAVLVLLCRSSEGVVNRCWLQNEYPWQYVRGGTNEWIYDKDLPTTHQWSQNLKCILTTINIYDDYNKPHVWQNYHLDCQVIDKTLDGKATSQLKRIFFLKTIKADT